MRTSCTDAKASLATESSDEHSVENKSSGGGKLKSLDDRQGRDRPRTSISKNTAALHERARAAMLSALTLLGSAYPPTARLRIKAQCISADKYENFIRGHIANLEQIANVGQWHRNVKTDRLFWSDQTYRIFGFAPQAFVASYPTFLDHIHPKDRARVEGVVHQAMKDRAAYDVDYRILREDGATRDVRVHGEITRDFLGRVKRLNGFIRDITEAKEGADSATHAKSRFLANIGHELRTPLNAIIGFSEMIRMQHLGPLGHERYIEYVADIHRSGQHLLKIINDILDAAKIEVGRIEIEETIVDLGRIAHESLDAVQERAEKSRITLRPIIQPSMPNVLADEQKLRRALENLLTNAVRFTPEGGQVTMRATLASNNTVVLQVVDSGIGISEEWLSQLGQPFIQVENDLNRRHEGTGLGLYLCKAILEMHGGTLTIESRRGIGTAVTAYLPSERVLGRAHRRAAASGA